MRKEYNFYQDIDCKKCGKTFFKTPKSGNLCRSCRRGKEFRERHKPYVDLTLDETLAVIAFVDRIENSYGFLYSLSDLNDLITYWYKIKQVNTSVYDTKPPGHQLHHMWLDLRDYAAHKKSTYSLI